MPSEATMRNMGALELASLLRDHSEVPVQLLASEVLGEGYESVVSKLEQEIENANESYEWLEREHEEQEERTATAEGKLQKALDALAILSPEHELLANRKRQ